jgi:hypothetical protein
MRERRKNEDYRRKIEEVLKNLHFGDIIIYHGTGFNSWAIRKFTGDERTHTSLYMGEDDFGEPKFAEAIYYTNPFKLNKWGAIEHNSPEYSFSHCKKIEVYRPKTHIYNIYRALRFLENQKGKFKRYDSLNTIKYVANRLFGFKLRQTRRNDKFYCSNLAIESYRRVCDFNPLKGVEIDNMRLILPKDIVKSKKLKKVGEFSFN